MAVIFASCTKTEETGIDAGPWDSAIPDACRDCDEDSGAGTDAAVDSGREGPDERPVCLFDYGPSVIVTKGRSKRWENFKEVFAYTRTGLVRSMEQFEEDNGEWKCVYSITFRYDPEGRLASSIEETLSGNLRIYGYMYDSESRLSIITWVEEYASAEMTGRLALTHDASGRVWEASGCEYCNDAIREISIYRLYSYSTDDTVESTRFSECSSDCYQTVRNLVYHPDSLLDQVSGMCGYGYPVGEMTYFSEKYLWSDAGVLVGMLRDEALDYSPPSTLLPAYRRTNGFDGKGRIESSVHQIYSSEEQGWIPDGTTEYAFTDAGTSCTFEMTAIYSLGSDFDRYGPVRWWALDRYGQGEINRYKN